MRRQKGFTLVELLIVIAIIGVLAGLIVGIATMARKQMYRTKCKTNISTLCTALEAYNTQTGVYPGAGITGKAQDNPEALFRALYTANPKIGGARDNFLSDWPVEQLGKWTGAIQQDYAHPVEEELDFTSGMRIQCVFLDPWGHAYHYAEFDSRAQSDRQLQGGQLKGGAKSYAIWSDGLDLVNDWGKNDDVNSWSEGSAASSGGKK